jgi:hypothetical protein
MTLSSGGWMLLGIYRRQRLVQTQTARDGAAMVEP